MVSATVVVVKFFKRSDEVKFRSFNVIEIAPLAIKLYTR